MIPRRTLLLASSACLLAAPALAGPTIGQQPGAPPAVQLTGNAPVTFQADSVTYDRDHGLVSALGHVEAWQNDHILRADRVTFDRNTNVAAAYGHVVIVEPDGEVIFADYAELSQGMKDGVLTGMRALMAQNGKLAGNGGRRIDGKLNVLSRAVYSTCNVCALDPTPTWQLRATTITQDLEHKRLEYTDATLEMFGLPVLYLPYFSNSDPSVRRQSGFLIPNVGHDTYLGTFASIPYYWVLDDQSDATITPTVDTAKGPQLALEYRRDFNEGNLLLDGAIASDEGLQGYIFGSGLFSWNDTWRYGFNVNLASGVNYLRDFQVPGYGAAILTSSIFAEGFGSGAYARLDVRSYQGLNSTINQSTLPYVLPRYEYAFQGETDGWGGRTRFETQDFDILRDVGTNDQRLAARVDWTRPFAGALGDRWLFMAEAAGAVYRATGLTQQPNYGPVDAATTAHVQPQVSLKLNWPFVRTGASGSQIVEPIVQVIEAPQSGNSLRDRIPNEDSLDYEFTDSTLFETNRFQGYDRFDGGLRANYALHAAWIFPGGAKLDGLVGQSWEQHIDQNASPQFQPWNGFEPGQHASDVVARLDFSPNPWLDFAGRGRVDPRNGDVRFADATIGVGKPILRLQAGYLYGATNPYFLYLADYNLRDFVTFTGTNNRSTAGFLIPREELSAGLQSKFGHYTLGIDARRDLHNDQMVSVGAHARYEDECFAFDVRYYRRYTQINYDTGDRVLLFTITLKTVGMFGFSG